MKDAKLELKIKKRKRVIRFWRYDGSAGSGYELELECGHFVYMSGIHRKIPIKTRCGLCENSQAKEML